MQHSECSAAEGSAQQRGHKVILLCALTEFDTFHPFRKTAIPLFAPGSKSLHTSERTGLFCPYFFGLPLSIRRLNNRYKNHSNHFMGLTPMLRSVRRPSSSFSYTYAEISDVPWELTTDVMRLRLGSKVRAWLVPTLELQPLRMSEPWR